MKTGPHLKIANSLLLILIVLALPYKLAGGLIFAFALLIFQALQNKLSLLALWKSTRFFIWMLFIITVPVMFKNQAGQADITVLGLSFYSESVFHFLWLFFKATIILWFAAILRLSLSGNALFFVLNSLRLPVWLQGIIIFLQTFLLRMQAEFKHIRLAYNARTVNRSWKVRWEFLKQFSVVYFIRLILRGEKHTQAMISRGFPGQQSKSTPVIVLNRYEWARILFMVSLLLVVTLEGIL
jgi:energy-coupling factor transporter transmembrane protein EcfT